MTRATSLDFSPSTVRHRFSIMTSSDLQTAKYQQKQGEGDTLHRFLLLRMAFKHENVKKKRLLFS